MTPVPRAAWPALLAALAVGLLLGWAPADAAGPAHGSADRAGAERVVFTGTFVRRPQVQVVRTATVRRYQVAVADVYGSGVVTTARVTVRSRLTLENCGSGTKGAPHQQGPSAPPSAQATPASPTIDKRLRLFVTARVGGDYVVRVCSDVTVVDAAVLADLATRYGQGRPPGSAVQPPAPLDPISYECPDTRDPVQLDSADSGAATCAALADTQSFDRAAAPGLALVIVGVLGLLVVRRMGRRA